MLWCSQPRACRPGSSAGNVRAMSGSLLPSPLCPRGTSRSLRAEREDGARAAGKGSSLPRRAQQALTRSGLSAVAEVTPLCQAHGSKSPLSRSCRRHWSGESLSGSPEQAALSPPQPRSGLSRLWQRCQGPRGRCGAHPGGAEAAASHLSHFLLRRQLRAGAQRC